MNKQPAAQARSELAGLTPKVRAFQNIGIGQVSFPFPVRYRRQFNNHR